MPHSICWAFKTRLISTRAVPAGWVSFTEIWQKTSDVWMRDGVAVHQDGSLFAVLILSDVFWSSVCPEEPVQGAAGTETFMWTRNDWTCCPASSSNRLYRYFQLKWQEQHLHHSITLSLLSGFKQECNFLFFKRYLTLFPGHLVTSFPAFLLGPLNVIHWRLQVKVI